MSRSVLAVIGVAVVAAGAAGYFLLASPAKTRPPYDASPECQRLCPGGVATAAQDDRPSYRLHGQFTREDLEVELAGAGCPRCEIRDDPSAKHAGGYMTDLVKHPEAFTEERYRKRACERLCPGGKATVVWHPDDVGMDPGHVSPAEFREFMARINCRCDEVTQR